MNIRLVSVTKSMVTEEDLSPEELIVYIARVSKCLLDAPRLLTGRQLGQASLLSLQLAIEPARLHSLVVASHLRSDYGVPELELHAV